MAKIRHIAYRAADVEAMAKFFVSALGMTITQRRRSRAIDLSDGSINITVLPMTPAGPDGKSPQQGIDHIGFTVADEDATGRLLEAEGATKIRSIELGSTAHYEVKYKGPEGIVIDLGHWVGTSPIDEKREVSDETKSQPASPGV
jgi:catechol 2,3-dioxygenase-like lactoylglutathione lyase family enzyme